MESDYKQILQETDVLVERIQAEIELSNRLIDRTKQVIAHTQEIDEKFKKQLRESVFYYGNANSKQDPQL